MNDTRRLFDPMVTRKPCTWSECKSRILSEWHMGIIAALPIIETDAGPMDDFLGDTPPCECVVVHNGRRYYVNPEGYSYARYAFRIANQ